MLFSSYSSVNLQKCGLLDIERALFKSTSESQDHGS